MAFFLSILTLFVSSLLVFLVSMRVCLDIRRAEAALEKVKERLVNYESQLALKDQTKDVALGTSKINYMDPRITVAWCKAKEVPLEMVFSKTLVSKFPWAMEVPMDWQF